MLLAAADPAQTLQRALPDLYDRNPFVVLLPGLFVSVADYGPIWLVRRRWILRQTNRDLGPKPATMPVWIAIWFLFCRRARRRDGLG